MSSPEKQDRIRLPLAGASPCIWKDNLLSFKDYFYRAQLFKYGHRNTVQD